MSEDVFRPREVCLECRAPQVRCYCATLRPFDPGIDFVFLVHPREARNPVGTVRMAHRFLLGSKLLECAPRGIDGDLGFRRWLEMRSGKVHVLYPGREALPLKRLRFAREWGVSPSLARPAFVVLDGTWAQARQMMRRSQLLQQLPQVSFETRRRSEYRIRHQPLDVCLSSLEAVHELLTQWEEGALFPPGARPQDFMLECFRTTVAFQVEKGGPARERPADRGVRRRI
jgi:DTW domain-containing protein YfiP